MHLGFEVVMLDGWSEVVEDYILAENIIRIGTIHAAVPYTDIQHTHTQEMEKDSHPYSGIFCCERDAL